MNTFFFDDVQYPEGLFGGKDFFNPIIYSTEEREVGVWVDGRPLYQKTFITNVTLTSGVWASTGDSILNGKAIDAEVTAIGQGSDTVPVWCEIGSDGHIELLNIIGSGQVTITHYTVRYFKTTDTAGSGSYTTLGVPAHHYDSNEKVVGTYFGETLYERTLNFTQDNRIYYIPNTSYVKKLVKHNGECTKDNFDFQIPYYDVTDYLSVGNDSNGVRIYSSNYFVGAVYELTIQYTKTTD